MEQVLEHTVGRLEAEISSYLSAVDAFRREGCEPEWAPENLDDEWCEPCVSGPRHPGFERRSA